jgi:hypothetical protein
MMDKFQTAAIVSGFYRMQNQLRCACGADGDRFWLRADGDGTSSAVCDQCHQEVACVTADLIPMDV